jgi:hypothetical protein
MPSFFFFAEEWWWKRSQSSLSWRLTLLLSGVRGVSVSDSPSFFSFCICLSLCSPCLPHMHSQDLFFRMPAPLDVLKKTPPALGKVSRLKVIPNPWSRWIQFLTSKATVTVCSRWSFIFFCNWRSRRSFEIPPFLQRQSIALAEAWGDNQVLPASSDTRSRALELRVLANDFLCPGGCPSKDSIEGLPIEFVIEPRENENEDGCGYCRRLRKRGEWAGAAEIVALSNVLRRSISVHQQSPLGSLKPIARYGGGESEAGTELRVLYVGNSHYMAVMTGTAAVR